MKARYTINATTAAEQDLKAIPEPTHGRILSAIAALADNPRPDGVTKMAGRKDCFRIRIGQYRVVYEIRDAILVVIVIAAAPRAKVYHLLRRR